MRTGQRVLARRSSGQSSLDQTRQVWALVLFISGLGLACAAAVWDSPAVAETARLSWWALVPAFVATQALPVTFEWRGQAWLVTLCQLPVTIGLFLLSPLGLLLARLLGTLAGTYWVRRPPLQKCMFNLSLVLLDTSVSIITFRALLGSSALGSSRSWLAALLAALTAELVDGVLLAAVIRIANPSWQLQQALPALAVSSAASSALVLFALIAASAILLNGQIAYLLIALALLLVLLSHAYSRLAEQHARLRGLHELLQRVGAVSPAVLGLDRALVRIREMLYADQLEFLDLHHLRDDGFVRVLATEGEIVTPVYRPLDSFEQRALLTRGAALLRPAGHRLLVRRACVEMVAPLFGDNGNARGLIRVRHRVGQVREFDLRDLSLLKTVAEQLLSALSDLGYDGSPTQASRDEATGLPNQRAALDFLVAAGTRRHPVTVCVLQVHCLADVEITLGAEAAASLLRRIADRLHGATSGGSFVARMDDDQLALLVLDNQDTPTARLYTAGLLAEVEGLYEISGSVVDATLSAGYARSSGANVGGPDLLHLARQALLEARAARLQLLEWNASFHHKAERRLRFLAQLQQDLAHNSAALSLAYQPIFNCLTGSITGYEALARWEVDSKPVAPGEFIPMLEEAERLQPLTNAVLGAALGRLKQLPAELTVSVNISGSLLDTRSLALVLERLLADSCVQPQRLVLEITESSLLTKRRQVALDELAGLGVRLSLDDFGTGFSSFSALRQLPLHEVKLDKSFVSDISADARGQAIVGTLVELAADLDVVLVAEGVESEVQLEHLRRLGVHKVQGNVLGRPQGPYPLQRLDVHTLGVGQPRHPTSF